MSFSPEEPRISYPITRVANAPAAPAGLAPPPDRVAPFGLGPPPPRRQDRSDNTDSVRMKMPPSVSPVRLREESGVRARGVPDPGPPVAAAASPHRRGRVLEPPPVPFKIAMADLYQTTRYWPEVLRLQKEGAVTPIPGNQEETAFKVHKGDGTSYLVHRQRNSERRRHHKLRNVLCMPAYEY